MKPGDVVTYLEMCQTEGVSLQRGMNFRLGSGHSVLLMSVRIGAPYADRVEEDGNILIYEGHDEPRNPGISNPKAVDQPRVTTSGCLTQNGLFLQAADEYKAGHQNAEIVRVYEKIKKGIWVFNGYFALTDAWQESSGPRLVFKFRLEMITQEVVPSSKLDESDLHHLRLIPSWVKQVVWKRDGGRCVECGATDNLHFDHVIPYSRGGSSLIPENIQLLCARHNLTKRNHIQ